MSIVEGSAFTDGFLVHFLKPLQVIGRQPLNEVFIIEPAAISESGEEKE